MSNRNADELNSRIPLYECPICNKKFVVMHSGRWAYKKFNEKKRKTLLYCSYKCYRKDGGDSGEYKREYTRRR